MRKKLIVLFPGINYSAEKPLLYYIDLIYAAKDYDQLKIRYENLNQTEKKRPMEELIEETKQYIRKQIEAFDFASYDEIIFVSKSIGTVFAGWLEEELGIQAQQIYLTPLPQTLRYLTAEKRERILLVTAGTKDRYLPAEQLKEHCRKENIVLRQFEGVGHRMEAESDVVHSIQIVQEIVKEIQKRIEGKE